MSVFLSGNLVRNLNHDDRIVRSVALDLLTTLGEKSLEFSKATLSTFEKRGLQDAFILETNRFRSQLDEEQAGRLLRFLDSILPEQAAHEYRRMDSLLDWLMEAPIQMVAKAEKSLEKIYGASPDLNYSFLTFQERIHFRKQCVGLDAETLRAMLEELLTDASEKMALDFPDREMILLHDLCPFLLEKDVISREEKEAWLSYEFDPEVPDYEAEFRLSTALELAIAAEESPDAGILLRNLTLDWDWVQDLVREIFCRFTSRDEVLKLFQLYPDADDYTRIRLGEIFANLPAAQYTEEIVSTLKGETSEEMLYFHAQTLASTGSIDGINAAQSLVDRIANPNEAIDATRILYTWHVLAEKDCAALEEWRIEIQADAEMQEEMQQIMDQDALLNAFEEQMSMPPLSEFADIPDELFYNPDRPQPDWNELAEGEKELIVIQHVEEYESEIEGAMEHARLHVMVENQVAMGDEIPVAATLERLMSEGLSRHESIHAIASAVIEELMAATDGKRTEEDYYERLSDLTAERWFAEYRPDPSPVPHETFRRSAAKVGRNDPCPCGSGRKYKQCCMKFAN